MASAAGNVRHGVTSDPRGVGQVGQGTRAGGLDPVRACLSPHLVTVSHAATGDVQLCPVMGLAVTIHGACPAPNQ